MFPVSFNDILNTLGDAPTFSRSDTVLSLIEQLADKAQQYGDSPDVMVMNGKRRHQFIRLAALGHRYERRHAIKRRQHRARQRRHKRGLRR